MYSGKSNRYHLSSQDKLQSNEATHRNKTVASLELTAIRKTLAYSNYKSTIPNQLRKHPTFETCNIYTVYATLKLIIHEMCELIQSKRDCYCCCSAAVVRSSSSDYQSDSSELIEKSAKVPRIQYLKTCAVGLQPWPSHLVLVHRILEQWTQ